MKSEAQETCDFVIGDFSARSTTLRLVETTIKRGYGLRKKPSASLFDFLNETTTTARYLFPKKVNGTSGKGATRYLRFLFVLAVS